MNPQDAVSVPRAGACGLCCTKLEDVTVRYRGHVALSNVNLHFHCGQLVAIVGPNGAGKSSLLRAILGEVPYSGRVRFADHQDRNSRRPKIGYMPQTLEIDRTAPVTVSDLFAAALTRTPVWLSRPKGLLARMDESLERVGAGHLGSRRLGELSGGELQRVLLALSITPVPDLLLLDEPVSAVDRPGMELFYRAVNDIRRECDLSVLLVSHDIELVAPFADRMVLIDRQVAASGSPEEVMTGEPFRSRFSAMEYRGAAQ